MHSVISVLVRVFHELVIMKWRKVEGEKAEEESYGGLSFLYFLYFLSFFSFLTFKCQEIVGNAMENDGI